MRGRVCSGTHPGSLSGVTTCARIVPLWAVGSCCSAFRHQGHASGDDQRFPGCATRRRVRLSRSVSVCFLSEVQMVGRALSTRNSRLRHSIRSRASTGAWTVSENRGRVAAGVGVFGGSDDGDGGSCTSTSVCLQGGDPPPWIESSDEPLICMSVQRLGSRPRHPHQRRRLRPGPPTSVAGHQADRGSGRSHPCRSRDRKGPARRGPLPGPAGRLGRAHGVSRRRGLRHDQGPMMRRPPRDAAADLHGLSTGGPPLRRARPTRPGAGCHTSAWSVRDRCGP
jgi:hypothetical protein